MAGVAGTPALKATEGFTRLAPGLIVVAVAVLYKQVPDLAAA